MVEVHRPSVWILTDGKAGDEIPLIGVAEVLGVSPDVRRVKPLSLFAWFMPWGGIDPREAPGRSGSPLSPPFPDICLATGRRAIAYVRKLKRVSPDTFTVVFKDPRTHRHGGDLVVVQSHDRLRGGAVVVHTTGPNRISEAALAALREEPPAILATLPTPRVAVLVGGNSRHSRFSAADQQAFSAGLSALAASGRSLMITASRRTPAELRAALSELGRMPNVYIWDGAGANPYLAILALADEVVVTADSTNMIGEAASTGRPIQIFHPSGGHRKIDAFIAALSQHASVGRFPDAPASGTYQPINSTGEIARLILERWQAHRR